MPSQLIGNAMQSILFLFGSRISKLLPPRIQPGRVNFSRCTSSSPCSVSFSAMYSQLSRSFPLPGHLLSYSSHSVVTVSKASVLPYASPSILLSSSM